MARYKWNNPSEWLLNKIQDTETKEFLLPLLLKVDSDVIQDIYQHEMIDDGYFNNLDKNIEDEDEDEDEDEG